jgi:hypothetical protein
MRVGIHQPNYIPWSGYFAKIATCDVFVFLDDAEISPGQSYVYRSQLRDEQRVFWLSQPSRRHPQELILDVEFSDPKWAQSHLARITQTYRKAPFFKEVMDLIIPHYQTVGDRLVPFNISMIQSICRYLDICCIFKISSLLKPEGISDERLISLVKLVGADTYVSGKGGQNYQDPIKFSQAGIQLEIHKYIPIPYQQIHGEFIGGLSILDALFNLGRRTREILVYDSVV